MSEQTASPKDGASEAMEPSFNIQRIYLKDLSLEQPNAPAILLVQEEPQIQVEIDVSVDPLAEGIFEVALISTLTARVDGKVLFLVEASWYFSLHIDTTRADGSYARCNLPNDLVPVFAFQCGRHREPRRLSTDSPE